MSYMKVGYARVDITPQESVPLAGYGNTTSRMSQTILDPLCATCIAFTDENGKSALIYTVDLIGSGYVTTNIRPAISQATGIPMEYIHVSATHTHAAPDLSCCGRVDSMARFLERYQAQMVQAAKDAIADQKEASLYLTRTVTKNLNFVRHYLMEDGTYSGPNFGNSNQRHICHESEADPELQLAKITRKGGKDIILCNFGVHQTNSGGQKKYDVSADIAGSMRAAMESAIDCHFAYFTAACGNVNPMSKIEEENIVQPLGDHVAHGKALAKYALDAADSYTEAQFGPIRTKCVTREFEINHTTDHLEEQAKEIHELYLSTNDRAMANQVGREKYGFSSVYQASAIIRRKKMPATNPVILNTLSVGDLAFALAPYEMFADNGVEIKQGSPFKMTMILTLANQSSVGYLPTRISFAHGGYAADTCRFMPGVGEELVQEFVGMFKDMYEQ